jgi:hypothetical protein
MQKLRQKLIKNVRYLTSKNHSLNDLKEFDTKKHFQFVLYKTINKNDFKPNKDECLLYLNSLFSAYQNFISQQNIRNKKLINYWNIYLSKNDREVLLGVMKFLNKHENYIKLKNYIIENIHEFNSKEIAFISKTFNSITFSSNELSEALRGYCVNNIEKFDLYDVENITFNNYNKPFFKYSLHYVIEKLIKENNDNLKLSIDLNDDKFENQMTEIDNEFNQKWLKLKILQNYKSKMSKNAFEHTVQLFFNDFIKLKDINQSFYEINCVISLCSHGVKLREIENIRLEKSILSPFLENDYLNKLFKNMNFFQYKSDLFNYFNGFICRKKLDYEQLDYLLKYFRIQIKNANNSHLFFDYCRIISVIIKFISHDEHYRQKVNLKEISDDIILDDVFYFNHFVNNIDNKFKLDLQVKYDHLINKFHGLNFRSINYDSLKFLIQVHKEPVDALNSFYTNFFHFYSTIDSVHLPHFRQQIINLLGCLIELKNDYSESNELKLCSLLDINFYYDKNFTFQSKINLITFLMLNKDTCLKNFKFIAEKISYLIQDHNHKLLNVLNLLDNYFDLLLSSEHRQDLFKILSILFKSYADKLLDINDVEKFSIQKEIHNIIIKMMRDIHKEKLINIDEKREIFHNFHKFSLILNENDSQNCVFNENNRYVRVDQKLDYLVQILKHGNNYSEKILDQIWNFLIQTFSLFLENSPNVKDIVPKLTKLLHVMSIYSHFDYTSNGNYLKNYKLLENLNNKVYNNILRGNISTGSLIIYVESLIGLNLFVENAFNDLIRAQVS